MQICVMQMFILNDGVAKDGNAEQELVIEEEETEELLSTETLDDLDEVDSDDDVGF